MLKEDQFKQFRDSIEAQYTQYKTDILKKSKTEIYNAAYGVAKMYELYMFFISNDKLDIDTLLPYADIILTDLYDFEMDYDTARWTTWDDIEDMLQEYLKENNKT